MVQWAPFLEHCLRVLRSGGILRLTEGEMIGLANSPACEQMGSWMAQLLQTNGYGFSHDGSHFAIMPMLGLLLREAGCEKRAFQPHMLDFSMGTPLHASQYQNYQVWFASAKSAVIRNGIITEEVFDQTYQRVFEEMQWLHFRGLWSLLTVWGEKRI